MGTKTIRILSLLVLLALFTLITLYLKFIKISQTTITLPNNQTLNIEIADTPFKQERGLMYRKELPKDSGMLFIFDDVSKQIFWMKNTYIPLDMIWLDENLKIVDITHNAEPCTKDPCKLYMGAKPVKYVLEVNANFAKESGLKTGDQLKLK